MKMILLLVASATFAAPARAQAPRSPQPNNPRDQREALTMDSLTRKTIQWTFDDGPMARIKIEHTFDADGSVTWRIADGPDKGASRKEKSYGAVKVNDKTWVLSYLAASGHTLTAVLNLDDGRVVAFGSNATSWEVVHGRFEIVGQ